MAIKNNAQSATSDGDQLNDGYFNDIELHRKQYTDATAYTTTSTSFVNKASFTVSSGASGIIFGIFFRCTLKNSNGSYKARVRLRVYGTTLGTYYLSNGGSTVDTYHNVTLDTANSTSVLCEQNGSTSDQYLGASIFCGINTPDATTTIYIDLNTDNGSNTATLDNIECNVLYKKGYIED